MSYICRAAFQPLHQVVAECIKAVVSILKRPIPALMVKKNIICVYAKKMGKTFN